MINIDHVCEDQDCPHIGQRTFPGCKCHKTREQMLEAEVVRLRERLAVPAQATLPPLINRAELVALLEDLASVALSREACVRQARRMADDLIARGLTLASLTPSTGLPAPAPHAEVREALEFYAKEWQLNGDGDSETPGLSRSWMEPTDALHNDEGRKAREALALPQSTERPCHGPDDAFCMICNPPDGK